MAAEIAYQTERLDHLGIVAGICRDAGIAEWLDAQAGASQRQVSVGTAVVAMILNGLGFSNRQLYLVPQFFATKPVEHVLGKGITANQLNDDCLGRTLDWISEHDPTTLFAGLTLQARRRFGVTTQQVHVDTTSFLVNGAYLPKESTQQEHPEEEEAVPIAITYGYSRDHRADLKQWMLGLVTPHDRDLPLFMCPLDGNSSDKESISTMVTTVMEQLRTTHSEEQEEPLVVFDSGGYSASNMRRYNQAQIRWISRVPETSKEAQQVLQEESEDWQAFSDESGQYRTRLMDLPQGKERWIMVLTKAGEQAARVQMEKKLPKVKEQWHKKLWHLSTKEFACQQDAEAAWKQELKGKPSFLVAAAVFQQEGHYQHQGRPTKETPPDFFTWKVVPTLWVDQEEVEALIKKQASFLLATNVLEEQKLSAEQVYRTYKAQGGVERGFRFLKDPLFLASSVFVKKPERVVALSFIMVLCLLVYRLAEHHLRRQLAATAQTVPNQVNKPTNRPTMRWIFQCFEGIDLLHIQIGSHHQLQVLGLQPLHLIILRLLGSSSCQCYFFSP